MKTATALAIVLAILGLAPVVMGEDKPAKDGALQIPLGKAAAIDGKLEDAEWSDALAVKVGDAGAVRLKHDKESLYLSWSKFPGQGYACLFVKSGDNVKVFHASQALGSALYEKKGDVWNPKVKAYAWKKPDVLWKDEGWKATTQAPAGQEFAVSFKTLGIEGNAAATIALGYVYFEKGEGKSLTWPDAKDACGDSKLLGGWNPEGLKFDFSKWAVVRPAAK